MQMNWTTIFKCLIVIQLVAVVGCKKGATNKNSTSRQQRVDNKAKAQQQAREAQEKARLEEEQRRRAEGGGDTGDTGTGSDSGATGIERPLQAGLKGKLADGSYITNDSKRIDLSGKDCTIVSVVSGPNGWVRLKFGEGLKEKIELPVKKEFINENLKEFKIPTKTKVERIINKSRSQIVYNRILKGTIKDVLELERSVITFKDKKPADLTDKDISDAIQRIKEQADNTEDLLLETGELNVKMKGKKYLSFLYGTRAYEDTSALPSDFLLGEKVEASAETSYGEGEETSNLNCEFAKR